MKYGFKDIMTTSEAAERWGLSPRFRQAFVYRDTGEGSKAYQ